MRDPRPDLREAAEAVYAALVADRETGHIPPDAVITVIIVPDVSLCVRLEALNNAYLFTSAQPGHYTIAARRLGRFVLDTVLNFLPRNNSGTLRHYFDVHLIADGHSEPTATTSEGVRVLRRKDTT